MHTRPHRRPRTQVPKSRVCKLRTAYLGAALCKRAQRQPNANSKLLDGCSTDPEPDMEKRQAFFRNMRSKCRCSCVLQFTRHHGEKTSAATVKSCVRSPMNRTEGWQDQPGRCIFQAKLRETIARTSEPIRNQDRRDVYGPRERRPPTLLSNPASGHP